MIRHIDGDMWRLSDNRRGKILKSHKLSLLGMVAVWCALMSAQGIAGGEAIIKIDGSNTMHSVTEAGAERFRAS
ncbi:MAG: hypothetical protein ABI257_02360, partial [Nitrosospira sp.]